MRIRNDEVVEAKESKGKARPQRGSKETPEGMRVVRKTSGETGERRAKRLYGGAEMEA